jgi:hypothetical protein
MEQFPAKCRPISPKFNIDFNKRRLFNSWKETFGYYVITYQNKSHAIFFEPSTSSY